METKQLEELNGEEVELFLSKIKFLNIKEKLLSGAYGEVTGELLGDLDDESLLNDLEITNKLVRKQFMKVLTKYKNEGVPIDMLIPVPAHDLTRATQKVAEITPVVTKIRKERKERTKLNSLLKKSTKITKACTSEMDIYAFPVKKILVSELKEPVYGQDLKKIIVMGETGSGKSTLLNAFVNYAAGVEIEDPFRFQLVVDEAKQATDQSNSQTTEISGYIIQDTELDFAIQIWDTPGFGDTGGVERDEEIKQQINELLKVEDFCHAICFVVKANVNRLTDTQRYIIDRVLLFFGKEVKENIYLLATFADDNRPEVLDALKNSNLPIDENRWFAFNNASLYKPASIRTGVSKIYWQIVNTSIENLFKAVGEIQPFSLSSTKEVIEQREDLCKNINAVSDQIERTVYKINEWEQNLVNLNSQKDKVISTGVFKLNTPIQKTLTVATKNANTICKNCFTNCHTGCGTWGVVFCNKFYWDWTCKICNCNYGDHHKQNYIYQVKMGTFEEIDTALKDENEKAKGNVAYFEQLKHKCEEEKVQEQSKLKSLITRIKVSMESLKKTAILNYSLDMIKYFQTLVTKEREQGNLEKADAYEKFIKQEEWLMKSESLDDEELIKERKESTEAGKKP